MTQTIQRSFTSGELAPGLRSRADLAKYVTGLALCENFIVRPQGGVYSRAGMRFVGEVGDSTKRARLIPFSFNTEQTYMLVFEHLTMRVIKDGGFVLDGAGPALFELVTPYTEAQLPRLAFTQTADVMTIVHPSHDPANLSRTGDAAWSLDDVDYSPTVASPTWAGDTVLTVTGATNAAPCKITTSVNHGLVNGNTVLVDDLAGLVTLNGNSYRITVVDADEFTLDGTNTTTDGTYTTGGTATLNGTLNSIGSGGGDFGKTYQYVVTAVDVNGVESLPSTQQSVTVDSLSTTFGINVSWVAVAAADYYRVYKCPSVDTSVFGWIGDSNTTTFDDFNVAPIVSDAPPGDRQPFAAVGDKPSAVSHYQQRQIFANTTNEPQTVYTTQTGNNNSLRVSNPSRDTDAVTFAIAAQQVNEIRHIVALNALILLTSGGEWRTTEGAGQVFTPSTVGVKIQSYNGASFVPPVVVNDTVIYVQEKGTKVRDLNYEFATDKYTGNDLSIMSSHLFERKQIEEMAHAAEPYGVLWCVRDDGVMVALTYQREHQVWGWHTHTTDGIFESVASITEGDRDAVYVIVNRTVNGATARYVERMEAREEIASEDCFYVDSGLTYDGVPASTMSGLDHLEGETVEVLADGYVIKDLVVSGGAITLPRDASKVHAGLPYVPVIETLDMDTAAAVDPLSGKSLSDSLLIIELYKSRGGWAGPILDDGSTGQMYEIKPRFDSDGYNSIALKTFKAEITLDPQWSKRGAVRIEQRDPLPMAILSVIPDVITGGR